MPRPKPEILLEHVTTDYRSEQVLRADVLYAVYYQGNPINLKSVNTLDETVGAKYKKTSFTNLAHCQNLAERLNKKFDTQEFMVVRLTDDR